MNLPDSLKKLSLREVQMIQLRLLKLVTDFCDKQGIAYFLIAGSLLGAVRHKGFIPWDDDIDIGMMRSDYEKFVCEFDIDDDCELITYKNSKEYYYPFAKVFDTNTLFIENAESHGLQSLNCLGVGIDIFPFDYSTDNLEQRKYEEKWRKRYLGRMYRKFAMINPPKESVLRRVAWRFIDSRKRLGSKESYLDAFNSVTSGNGPSETVVSLWDDVYFKTAWVARQVELEFEGELFKVPIGWDEYLTTFYGDYRTPVKGSGDGHGCAFLKSNEE